MILVTGGAGFIGSNFILEWLEQREEGVINIDALTYAGNLLNLKDIENDSRYSFIHGDICNGSLISDLLKKNRPQVIIHFAAESHVDRSIDSPAPFIQTNINGTFQILEALLRHHRDGHSFRFIHVSTDEVYGSLKKNDPSTVEGAPYRPSSPYAASKAASDHLVRSYHETYDLPTIVTNCTNNFGRFQFPEKLIPLIISNCADGKPLPIYGDGKNIRDWLHVSDMCSGLRAVIDKGVIGETYHIANGQEKRNIDVVEAVCAIMDELRPAGAPHRRLIAFTEDRPGHDFRYSLSYNKIRDELGWQPEGGFEEHLKKTVLWYLDNEDWLNTVRSGDYRAWVEKHYGENT
ncbi:MAG: dTDP-glucose 4,6-dehydratase [Chlamydiales bacterium]|nr:dTDP-glucose 4,6-dehydratase [Chlamydiia bacterium]MCP5508741.1 dTDP-glucose 4,6-dehydratase [Chlamydiales bacterium]